MTTPQIRIDGLSGADQSEILDKAVRIIRGFGVDPEDYWIEISAEPVMTVAETVICWRADVSAREKAPRR